MNVSITFCRSRAEAEKRKGQIRELMPDAQWRTRIIEDAESLSVDLLHSTTSDPENRLLTDATELNGEPDTGVVLVMWVDADD